MTSEDETQNQVHSALSPVAAVPVVLTVVRGVDVGLELAFDPSQPALLVGKSQACIVRLNDPMVSRRHASLEWARDRLRLRDLGSKNGTYVGRTAISEVFLQAGESFRVGETTLTLVRDERSPVRPLSSRKSFGRLIGVSHEMRRLYPLCERLAFSDVPVILEGETGTGKEVLAEALHDEGPRAAQPFIVFDCTAVPAALLESELFGHERGAFSGAVSARKGLLEEADGGTLLVDEIGDLPLELQAKLLRALERLEVRRVGGNRWLKVDVRILAATRRDLDHEVQQRRFRDDLFYRLAVGRIELPPLRSRKGDIGILVDHFCRQMKGAPTLFPPDLIAAWEDAAWPGNVRELRNAVARRMVVDEPPPRRGAAPVEPDDTLRGPAPEFAPGEPAPQTDLVERILAENLPLVRAREKLVRDFEARYVAHTLAQHGGNVTKAAAASGIARRHFQRVKQKANDPPPEST